MTSYLEEISNHQLVAPGFRHSILILAYYYYSIWASAGKSLHPCLPGYIQSLRARSEH